MKLIDDSKKTLRWWNRNYFFLATIIVTLVNILLYALLGNRWEEQFPVSGGLTLWYNELDFNNLIRAFMNSFSHSNWQHVLLNMLCFFICGIYLERKEGTLSLLFLVIVTAFFSSTAMSANEGSVHWHGFSGVNFALYAYIIVDFLFVFRKHTRSAFNIISGFVMLGLIYFAACFNGGTSSIGFEWYPYDFMHNMGHYSAFVAGMVLGFVVQFVRVRAEREVKR